MKPIFALVDCNSFYASCERVFNPALRNKPVIVLSNNDGCVVARTQEAKALQIPMGAPYFKIKDIIDKHGVFTFSSNYALYGDMSTRVMKTLSQFSPEFEIYSIDEAFLNLTGFNIASLSDYGQKIRKAVIQNTGIPVSVGIAPTKVLAKVANRIAKKQKTCNGIFDITSSEVQDKVLQDFPVEDIWGIGPKSTEKLRRLGITTAKQLRDAEEHKIQKILTIVGRRILQELRGVSCLPLELIHNDRKQIICSRSFGKRVFELSQLQESIATYVTRAAERLREQNSICGTVQVFIHTNRFKNTPQYFNFISLNLLAPTSATNRLIEIAFKALRKIYRQGYEYKKAGVVLLDIRPNTEGQLSFFESGNIEQDDKLMVAIDKINSKIGQDTVKYAACGLNRQWRMLSQHRSRCFTTRWADLLVV